jgi:hypothetical protein
MKYKYLPSIRLVSTFISLALSVTFLFGDDEPEGIRPTPLTRPEMKKLLEEVKHRTPRIPLPDLSEEERDNPDPRFNSYESRVRRLYLDGFDANRSFGFPNSNSASSLASPGTSSSSGARNQDPLFTLSDELKVELFWIVSRVNNCQYCIGHQESKLLRLGLTDDRIASLDFDWSGFDTAHQAAFGFGRKLTLEPHQLSDMDFGELKKYFTENQILEMVLSMAGNNSINRWKEAIGVPQNADGGGYSSVGRQQDSFAITDNFPRGSYETPTNPGIASRISTIVVKSDRSDRQGTCMTSSPRPALESRDWTEQKLAEAASRVPRLSMSDDATTRSAIPSVSNESSLPNYIKLLARFPIAGGSRVEGIQASFEKGALSQKVRWQMAWILARQDRAWYALGLAKQKLLSLGETLDSVYSLDGDWENVTPIERSLFVIAKNLGNSPVVLNGAEVKSAVDLCGPRDVVQAISFITSMTAFNRITEAAGLPVDKIR